MDLLSEYQQLADMYRELLAPPYGEDEKLVLQHHDELKRRSEPKGLTLELQLALERMICEFAHFESDANSSAKALASARDTLARAKRITTLSEDEP